MNHPELDEVDMFKIPWNQMRNILSISREQETQINQKHTESSEFEQYIEFLSKIELLWEQSEGKQSCRGGLDMLTHQNLDL